MTIPYKMKIVPDQPAKTIGNLGGNDNASTIIGIPNATTSMINSTVPENSKVPTAIAAAGVQPGT
jgi:hypothetical protein